MTDTPKYYGYLYEIIIPTSNGKKHYYGKKEYDHRCRKCTGIYETYWGSGIIIKDWFLAHTNNNYNSRCCPEIIALDLGVERIIHGFYITKEELNNAEKELVNQHLGKEYCINLASGGTGGNTHHYVCTEETKLKQRQNNLGTFMWNNGIINKKCKECPGPEWKKGMLLSKEEKQKRSIKMKNLIKDPKNRPSKEQRIKNVMKSVELRKRKVKCIELNLIFESLAEAQEQFNLTYNTLAKACENKNKIYKGYHWEFVDD